MERGITGGAADPVWITGAKDALQITGSTTASFSDNATIDAFGRLRVSNPYTLFDSALQYSSMPLYWGEVLANGGTVTHLPNESSTRMRVTTTNGSSVIRQTKRYWRYQPGKSQRITCTGVLGEPKAGVRKRIGYFDDENGLFFEQTEDGMFVVKRSFVSGVAVDTRVAQANWNLDVMDGNTHPLTNPSGITLNAARATIFLIDLEWLGVGRVRFGFVIDGKIYYVHEFNHANSITSVYMTTANLPVRYEIENTAGTASNTDLIEICAEVSSEGGVQERAQVFSVGNEESFISVSTTLIPILSIRLDTVFPANGSITNRTSVIPLKTMVFTEDAPCYFKVLYNATLTNPVWADYNTTHSGVQYDVSASAVSNGIEIDAGYVGTGRNVGAADALNLASELALTLDIAGTTSDTLTIAAIRTGTSNTDVGAIIQWKELY
jgi:hypothetical protein